MKAEEKGLILTNYFMQATILNPSGILTKI
jgi:hypothetical protein